MALLQEWYEIHLQVRYQIIATFNGGFEDTMALNSIVGTITANVAGRWKSHRNDGGAKTLACQVSPVILRVRKMPALC